MRGHISTGKFKAEVVYLKKLFTFHKIDNLKTKKKNKQTNKQFFFGTLDSKESAIRLDSFALRAIDWKIRITNPENEMKF